MNRASLYVALMAMACGGQVLDVGNTDPGGGDGAGATGATGGSIDPDVELTEWPAPDACAAMSNLDLVGVWQGHFQDAQFRNQVPLRVDIRGASENGGVCGTLKWGEGELPPPPTDPERGWPEGVDLPNRASALEFQLGATYTILEGGARGNQVRFTVAATEFWRPWCAILTPHWYGEFWTCIPEHVGVSFPEDSPFCSLHQRSGPDIRVELGKCNMCATGLCECNQSECTVSPLGVSIRATLDLVFEADRATGIVVSGEVGYTDVVLSRVE